MPLFGYITRIQTVSIILAGNRGNLSELHEIKIFPPVIAAMLTPVVTVNTHVHTRTRAQTHMWRYKLCRAHVHPRMSYRLNAPAHVRAYLLRLTYLTHTRLTHANTSFPYRTFLRIDDYYQQIWNYWIYVIIEQMVGGVHFLAATSLSNIYFLGRFFFFAHRPPENHILSKILIFCFPLMVACNKSSVMTARCKTQTCMCYT